MKRRKRDSIMDRILNQTALSSTEALGVNVAFNIAGDNAQAKQIVGKGMSLAGIPSLAYGAGTVFKSLKSLDVMNKPRRKKKKR